MSTRILISSDPDNLRAALAEFSHTATVEAEYGTEVVEGTEATLAHHGPRADQPCPCAGPNLDIRVGAIGISHFDLDTLGGVLRVLRVKPHSPVFWAAAGKVDLLGVHKLPQIEAEVLAELPPMYKTLAGTLWNEALSGMNAFWAWSEENRLSPPRDGSVQDCTEFFAEAIRVIEVILGADRPAVARLEGGGLSIWWEKSERLAAGRAWAASKAQLEESSYVTTKGGVILRMADTFTNHLYEHAGTPALAVVALNTKYNSVTISLADPIEGINCCTLMQRLFGPLAGGHAGIAGTPRGEAYMLHDAERVMGELVMEIAVATTEVIPA